MNKYELRKRFKAIRNDINSRYEAEKSITLKLLSNEIYTKSDEVFLYCSSKGEVSTSEILKTSLECGKKVALPVCIDSDGNMEFYYIKSLKGLHVGMYSILEPDISRCEKALWDDSTLLVVPALAFDKNGNRLGYGKGYYDRFLENFSGISVGLCFDECLCDYLPVNAYDKKVNCLITDKRTYYFKSKEE